jgi:hypothetical protein
MPSTSNYSQQTPPQDLSLNTITTSSHLQSTPLLTPISSQTSEEIQTNTGSKWIQVPNNKKRSRQSDGPISTKKQTYWLGETPETKNRFTALLNDNNMDEESHATEQKPPPIYVTGVQTIKPLFDLLNTIAKDKYTLKTLYNSQVKIQPLESTIYSTIVKALTDRQTEFHTYKPRSERGFRVVLRNVHPSTESINIKQSLQELGHEVINIWNIKQRGTKIPLPLFFIDLQPKANNKDIYGINLLLHTKVKFEPPHVKREIPQCKRCQKYGHTRNFCRNTPRCVKCAAEHLTDQCPRLTNDSNVKCANCNDHHPANYRGCIVHKQLQQKYYPPQRERNLPNNTTQPEVSYAQVAKRKFSSPPERNNTDIPTTSLQNTDALFELRHMIKTIMEQMGTLINLMTALITNLKK